MTMIAATAPALGARGALPRTYHVRTLGCQMNVHDSEHMAGLLEGAGYLRVEDVPEAAARATDAGDGGADVVIINTCSVRENAATRLFGNLGQLAAVKRERPGMQIAVAGCLAQQMGQGIVERAPWVDVVFGTHNLDVLPALLERARHNAEAAVELEESLKVFPSTPAHASRVRLCRLGVHRRGLQQHLHLLHRALPARQAARPPSRRRPG